MSNTTMREIGTFMNPVGVPISLRNIVLQHRWAEEKPVFSFRTIVRRHTDVDSVFLRFLSYNTYLMRVRINVAKALADFAGPSDVLKALGVDPHQVVKKAGKGLCNVLLPFPVNKACEAASNVVSFILEHVSLDKAVDAAFEALGPEAAIEFMLSLFGVPHEVTFEKKRALASRAVEIGDSLKGEHYDLATLSEVWTADVRKSLLEHWGLPTDTVHLAHGKFESNIYLGDGLLVGSKDGRIIETKQKTYKTRGIHRTTKAIDMLADDELFAQKGVILTRVNMGVGIVDLYLTHLYFGTGLLSRAPDWLVLKNLPGTEEPTNKERKEVRSQQLEELDKFIQQTHKPENIMMVCGDFNIDGNGKDAEYAGSNAVEQLMTGHNLVNVWTSQHGSDPGGDTGGDFGKICGVLQPGDSRFCEDPPNGQAQGGYRIDYILMERPRTEHAFMLDVTRVRRRPFQRGQPTDDQVFMSDHLGLDCTLFTSRK